MHSEDQNNMDNKVEDNLNSVNNTPVPKKSKNRSQKIIIVVLIAVLLVAIFSAVTAYFFWHKTKTQKSDSSVSKTSIPTQQSSDPNTITTNIPDSINPINPQAIPIGTGKISSAPQKGYIFSCTTKFGNVGGAHAAVPWIDAANNTWNSTTKTAVTGAVPWPDATYKVTVSGNTRTVSSNDLPKDHTSGTFPIASTDPAYQYDRNPNSIESHTINWALQTNPSAAVTPNCTGLGEVGIMSDGVVLFNALDGEGRDAAAYETLDSCDGHPQERDEYHHHNVPSCILNKTAGNKSTSTFVGYANDGYGLYVERDKNGNLLTNDNLDECHGRTSEVIWDGKKAEMYHYVATMEYPYTVGCFHGAPVSSQQQTGNQPPR